LASNLLRTVDRGRLFDLGKIQPAALRKERHRVVPDDPLNRLLADALLPHPPQSSSAP